MPLTKYPYYLMSGARLLTRVEPARLVLRQFAGTAGPGPHVLTLRGGGPRFKVRSAMDTWSVKETFLDRLYERFGFALEPGWNVIDIGAGVGDFTVLAALSHPTVRVAAFEPAPESFSLLLDNLRLNGVTNAVAFHEAVWVADGFAVLDTSGGEPSAYAVRHVPEARCGTRVATVTLETIVGRLRFERVDLVKLDCEGAEYAILPGTPRSVFEKIDRIVLEYHEGLTGHSHRELAELLERMGYRVETFANYAREELGYLRARRT